jgi:GAF domain-containing protein
LESIQKTSAAISAELDVDKLLQMIAKKAAEVFDAPAVSLMFWDELEERLLIEASWGLSDEHVRQQCVSKENVYTTILLNGEFLPFTVVDLRAKSFGPKGVDEGERFDSMLVVPLKIFGELVGTLNIYSKGTPRQFTHGEKELARIFASQVEVAIQNARSYQQVTQRARAMESLEKVGRIVTAALDLPQVLRSVVENANEVLGADISSLSFYDEIAKKQFPFGIGNVYGTIQTLPREWMLQIEGLADRVVGSKELLVVEDTASPELAAKSKATAYEICSSACCPLLVGEDMVGLLHVDFCTPHKFTADERQTIQMFANQAAIAIKNAGQYEDIERAYRGAEEARKRLDIVAAVGKAVSSTLDFERVLDALLIELGKVIDAPDRGILLYEESSDELVIHPSSYYNIDRDKEHLKKVRIGQGVTGWAAQAKAPCNVPDVLQDPRYVGLISTTRSELAVPVLHGDELIGVINLESPQPGAFDAQDVTLLQAIADQVAVAIKNGRQYEELVHTQEDLAAAATVAWLGIPGAVWSHDVNQKTSAIRYNTATLRDKLKDVYRKDDLVLEVLSDIEEAALAIQDIPMKGPLPAQTGEPVRPTPVDAVLKEQLSAWCAGHIGVELDLQLHSRDVFVLIDEPWLVIALEQLVGNALKAMPSGGHLTVASKVVGDELEITVKDTGCGIPRKALGYFLKGHVPVGAKRYRRGSGMGALTSKFILRSYGGDLELLWTEEEKGTALRISLPVVQDAL